MYPLSGVICRAWNPPPYTRFPDDDATAYHEWLAEVETARAEAEADTEWAAEMERRDLLAAGLLRMVGNVRLPLGPVTLSA